MTRKLQYLREDPDLKATVKGSGEGHWPEEGAYMLRPEGSRRVSQVAQERSGQREKEQGHLRK